MEVQQVPPALCERLGADAAADLVQVVNTAGREWKEDTMNVAEGRFERRLVEETSKLRIEITKLGADLRFDLLKWSFIFWVGQVAAMTAIINLLLRTR